LEEEYQRNLEEETLLQTLEEAPLCPGCSRKVKNDWLVCPTCRTRLNKKCVSCGRILELNWEICPYCETAATGYHRTNISIDDLVSQNIDKVDFKTNLEE
jgi:RNA polymerase subunit RPABC4/transcription elongation factor Spt4